MAEVAALLDVCIPQTLKNLFVSLVGHVVLREINEHLDKLHHAVGGLLMRLSPAHDVADLGLQAKGVLGLRDLRPVGQLLQLAADS